MGKYVNHLVSLLKKREKDFDDFTRIVWLSDEKRKKYWGVPLGSCPFMLSFLPACKKWRVESVDESNGVPIESADFSSEKDACLAFLDMTESFLHLKRYAPEFEKIA